MRSVLMNLLLIGVAVAAAVFVASKIVPGVKVKHTKTLVMVGLVFGGLNILIGWLLRAVGAIALLPAAIVTFGLAYLLLGLIVNAVLLWITDKVVGDFELRDFKAIALTSVLVTVAGWLVQRL